MGRCIPFFEILTLSVSHWSCNVKISGNYIVRLGGPVFKVSLKSWQSFSYLSVRDVNSPYINVCGFICQAKSLLSLDQNLETRITKDSTGYLHLYL